VSGTLDDLKGQVKDIPISEILARYVQVSKKGTQTLAVCPFHDDHSPSLNINDHRGMWYCFVDQIGGDAIKFVQLYKRLEFIEALKDICDQLGWNFQDYVQEKKSSPKIEMGRRILSKTSQLYQKLTTVSEGQEFKKFLKKRNLSEEIAHQYSLGFAPKANALTEYLHSIKEEKEKDFALKTAQELGVIKPGKFGQNNYYDTFRERIMFPIWDHFGQVIGFTSRAIHDDQKPKYRNSEDSFLFNKKNLLYGLHFAKPFIRDQDKVVLVEGNMDQIALTKNGFVNSVAIMGVALGDPSLKKLLALTKNVYLCLDNDQAGLKATERINIQFMEQGITPYFVELGDYKDPDDFLEKEGKLAFQERLDKAKTFIDWHLNKIFPTEAPQVAERQLDYLIKFFAVVQPLGMTLSATERIVTLAKKLGLQSDSSTIIRHYEEFLQEGAKKNQGVRQKPIETPKSAPALEEQFFPEEERVELPSFQLTRVEKTLLQQLVQHPELLERDEIAELLDFVGPFEVKQFISRLQNIFIEIDENEYENILKNVLSEDEFPLEISLVAGAALENHRLTHMGNDEEQNKMIKKMILDIKLKLTRQKLMIEKDSLKAKQKEAATQEEHHGLLSQLIEIDKKLLTIKNSPKA
jgi:DNA primase